MPAPGSVPLYVAHTTLINKMTSRMRDSGEDIAAALSEFNAFSVDMSVRRSRVISLYSELKRHLFSLNM